MRKMFRDDMASYRAKAEAMRKAEVYRKEYAIAECPSDIESPTVLAAQTANELLDISGIKASFVLTVYEGKIYLSAVPLTRSMYRSSRRSWAEADTSIPRERSLTIRISRK